jgi:hypothetical protein
MEQHRIAMGAHYDENNDSGSDWSDDESEEASGGGDSNSEN